MIINGQHSIQASKELHLEGCGEERRRALEKWDVIIVWDLDPVRLTKILKFYNMTNHLNHAQPTWGNQIVSGRNIWISLGRLTDKVVEAEARRNGAVQNFQAYMVSSISVGCHLVIFDSRITCTLLSSCLVILLWHIELLYCIHILLMLSTYYYVLLSSSRG
jgi:hypothetical protein